MSKARQARRSGGANIARPVCVPGGGAVVSTPVAAPPVYDWASDPYVQSLVRDVLAERPTFTDEELWDMEERAERLRLEPSSLFERPLWTRFLDADHYDRTVAVAVEGLGTRALNPWDEKRQTQYLAAEE